MRAFGARDQLALAVAWCMIKIFRRGRGDDTFKSPSPYEQLLPLPTPCFKMFLERSLNDPPPPPTHFKHLSLLPLSPSTTPPPLKILIIHVLVLTFCCDVVGRCVCVWGWANVSGVPWSVQGIILGISGVCRG